MLKKFNFQGPPGGRVRHQQYPYRAGCWQDEEQARKVDKALRHYIMLCQGKETEETISPEWFDNN